MLEQHRLNRLNPHEEAELDEWYEALDDPSVEPVYAEDTPEAKAYVARHTKQIMSRIASQRRGRTLRMWMKVAAVLLAGLVIAYLVWPEGQNKADKGTALATEATGSTRYVTLPDGSTVILSKGSSCSLCVDLAIPTGI
ncbi:hypothetical protein KRR40_27200 [Niabella defluvii]|nr:hypothetical protein KRR40_27200 [Niabella sp. I65]